MCIDDQNELRPKAYECFLEVHNLGSAVDVQRALLRAEPARRRAPSDLILCDINMQNASEVADQTGLADVFWGDGAGRPYGVLLALPFLGWSGLTTFVPYSNFWGTKAVHSNGFVLVALSLIQALSKGREQGLEQIRAEIVATGTKDSLAEVPDTALQRGLEALRRRIEEDESIQLLDVEWTLQRLGDAEDAAERAGAWPLDVPLRDSEGPIALGIGWSASFVDFIEVSSIFSDVIGFGNPSREDIRRVAKILMRWSKVKGSIERRGDTLFQAAKQVLELCEPENGDGQSFIAAVKESEYVRAGGDQYLLRRTVMLFAWIKAWHDHGAGARSEVMVHSVHEQLGLVVHGADGKERTDPSATTKYKGFLSSDRKTVSAKGPRRGFRRSHDVAEAFNLASDTPADGLDANDRDLCIRFAEEVLDWKQPGDQPYPRWMSS
jgi:hypothetical protein